MSTTQRHPYTAPNFQPWDSRIAAKDQESKQETGLS